MNIELCAGYGLVKLTPAFTNAMFSVLLGVMNDTATQLDLPIPTPVRAEHVRGFSIDQTYRETSGSLGLTNGVGIDFRHGYVWSLRIPPVYFDLQSSSIPETYYGTNQMNSAEAVQFARETILKLGYSLEDTFADLEPRVTPPFIAKDGRVVPRYMIEWLDPVSGTDVTRFEIDSANRRLAYASFISPNMWRPPRHLDVPRPEPQPDDGLIYQPTREAVSLDYALALLPQILDASAEAIEEFELPVELPLSTNQIARYHLESLGRNARVKVTFKNAAALEFLGTRLIGVRQPESLYGRVREKIHARDFAGQWKLTDEQSLALAREQFRKLVGQSDLFPLEQMPEHRLKLDLVGTNLAIPRILFRWHFTEAGSDQTRGTVKIEVDAENGRVVSMNWSDVTYRNDPPALDLPIEAPLPAGSGDLYLAPLGHPN